ncbi:hypothetical protein CEXT_735361 [Caerostris extrusa]|uniref:Uncharacterized protein n=1 Tax=Caerostris extrusa TaxID=172846 RepID=A0AAV4Y8S9_CAEEX|nr:hypothetical protein CEXT_735361 [Caerostris extrusa]
MAWELLRTKNQITCLVEGGKCHVIGTDWMVMRAIRGTGTNERFFSAFRFRSVTTPGILFYGPKFAFHWCSEVLFSEIMNR